MKILSFLLPVMILASCKPIASILPQATETPLIQFQSPTITRIEAAEQRGLDLTVGIFAIDEKTVFLYGGMMGVDGEPQSFQSTLLRSIDGGVHWEEVMAPVSDSAIREFIVHESGIGWVLMRKVGPPDEYTMYQTVDFGNHWKKISIIPLSSEDIPIALQMIFLDDLHGEIDMLYYDDYIEFLTTNDGGAHWKQAGQYKPEFDGHVSNLPILESYLSLAKDQSKSYGFNHHSYWELNGEYGDPAVTNLIIYRTIYSDDFSTSNQSKIVLPKHFNYRYSLFTVP